MLKEGLRQRKTERAGAERRTRCCGAAEVCAPPSASWTGRKSGVSGGKVGGRGQRKAEESASV